MTKKYTRILIGFVSFLAAALSAFAGFSIQNGLLIDNNGNEFIMRGINYPHVWYPSQTATSIPNIAATGSNCVRVVLGDGKQWGPNSASDVAQLIQLCKDNRLIAVLEVHDSTGYGDTGGYAPGAAPLSTAVDYWLSIQSALTGQENFVIINIANEPFGNGVPASTFVASYKDAIARLRAAGFTHTLMIDAANWGQDWEQILQTNAGTLFASDPLKNIIFSVHMYQVYAARSTIQSYLTTFVTAQLPLVVGEFGPINGGQPADAASVMELTQTLGLGYMGWSWSGNGGGSEPLDLTLNFDPAQLTTWGNNLINGVNGIAATSQLASVFANVARLQLSPTALSLAATAQSATVNVKTNQSWAATADQTWITLSPKAGTGDGSIAVTVAANANIGPRTGTVTVAGGGLSRSVTINQTGAGGPGVCGNQVAISLPLVKEGVGEFCLVTSGDISYVNSWNMQTLEINGVSYANKFSATLPAKIDGYYYIHYVGALSYAHVEIAGTNSSTNVPVTGVTVTPATATVALGGSATLTATVVPSNASNATVTWSSSATSIATVNASGVVVGLAPGTAVITATTQSGSFTASTTVTVIDANIPVTGVTVSPTTTSVGIGGTTTLTASVTPSNATNKTITWSSDASSIATVSASGVVTGVAAGNATITATTASGGFAASSVVTVTTVPTTPCSNPAAATLPLARDGVGEFCIVTSGTVSNLNSWNMQKVEINGVDFTNKWASTSSLPAKINGSYYIHYVGTFPWSHLEVNGTP